MVEQDHKALGDAVRGRRENVGISQREASDQSKQYDVEVYPDKAGRYPGISVTAWANIEQAKPVTRRPHTLELVDAVLRWPAGTARAIAYGHDRPDGDPVSLPSESAPDIEADGTPSRLEVARLRQEVASLRVDVARLHEAVSKLRRVIGES